MAKTNLVVLPSPDHVIATLHQSTGGDKGMTEPAVDALGIARSELTPRLNAIATSDWEKATPCTEWNVRQLVNHVVGLHHRVARLVRGGSRDEYIANCELPQGATAQARLLHLAGRQP